MLLNIRIIIIHLILFHVIGVIMCGDESITTENSECFSNVYE